MLKGLKGAHKNYVEAIPEVILHFKYVQMKSGVNQFEEGFKGAHGLKQKVLQHV